MTRQLQDANSELHDLRQDHYRLQGYYEMIDHENETLRAELSQLRFASQTSHTSHTSLDELGLFANTEDNQQRQQKSKSKGKKPIRHAADEEAEEEVR